MKVITDAQSGLAGSYTLGGKATNLFRLKKLGVRVPAWVVIPSEFFVTQFAGQLASGDVTALRNSIDESSIPKEMLDSIRGHFESETLLAVRSSATDEDGTGYSFAGQFESFLFVKPSELESCIKAVWHAAFAERVIAYRKHHNLKLSAGLAVIIQEMVDADASGVAFGINPVTGSRKSRIINAVYGLGEGLVSGDLNADTYQLRNGVWEIQTAAKTHKWVRDETQNRGTRKVAVPESLIHRAALDEPAQNEIAATLDKALIAWGKPQDMEFAIKDRVVYFLQSRPITNLTKLRDPDGAYILWDNSNIIESYPGVTTPLTFSFISKSYELAYKHFSGFMGVDRQTIQKHEHIFTNTLGLIQGRVYYNLKTWYHMLALLPGYSLNARFMEKMMGVKERFDVPDDYRISKNSARFKLVMMALRMAMRYLSLNKKRQAFIQLLNQTISEYKSIPLREKNASELMSLYLNFEKKLIFEWKTPLLNDFFTMIWFGILQKQCEKFLDNAHVNLHNDLLCGSKDIISTQPIHRCIKLATGILHSDLFKEIFLNHEPEEILERLSADEKCSKLKEEIDQYIFDFGERCIGELKLETVSYTRDPAKFIRVLKSYVLSGITEDSTSGKTESELRLNAEITVNRSLKYKPLKRWILKGTLKRTRTLVSSRENLRYERTRAFGIVRELFAHIGRCFYSEDILEDPSDIFYLSREEIFAFIEGRSVQVRLKDLVKLRREEFASYQKAGPTAERLATYGPVYHANDFYKGAMSPVADAGLKGIGCCPGIVRAKARVVLNPETAEPLDGCILVTISTDPGWVTLFPGASGIIVERGSLLSHSAIVSREMGKPCIVSVTGLLQHIQTGDEIEMDGSTGAINIIKKAHE